MITPHADKSLIWRLTDYGRHFLLFMVIEAPAKIYDAWRLTATNFESQIGVVVTLQNLGKPLYQDYTREGRLVGFFFRLLRVLVGVVVQFLILALFIMILIGWYLLPLAVIYQLVFQLLP